MLVARKRHFVQYYMKQKLHDGCEMIKVAAQYLYVHLYIQICMYVFES